MIYLVQNWYVSAPGFIAKRCPAGWRDDGTTCWLDAETYGRGEGYPWKFGDGFNLDDAWSRCERDQGSGNCEKYGEIIYPKCRRDFHPSGCCTCLRDTRTQSKSVTGQVGTIPDLVCGSDEEKIAGLCYKKQQSKDATNSQNQNSNDDVISWKPWRKQGAFGGI
jgi:hypothetical protein